METVSAILPFFNSSATIRSALASICAQTLKPVEIIVVDDASRPQEAANLQQIAAAWASDIPLQVVHQQRNGGPATARNEGWRRAMGKWVAFCDADDVWHPRRLECQLDVAATADLLGSSRAPAPELMRAPLATSPLFHEVRRSDILLWNRIMTSSALIRRDIAERFPEGRRYSEDYELWLRIVLRGGRTVVLDHPLIAPQIPDSEAVGLSTHRLDMTKGELIGFNALLKEGLMSKREYGVAVGVGALRALRRHGADALRKASGWFHNRATKRPA